MPSILGSLDNGQPLVDVLITSADPALGHVQCQCIGLIDTGSSKTCITRTVVEQLHLVPFTRILVATPSGLERRKAYAFSIGFLTEGDRSIGSPRAPHMLNGSLTGADFVKNSNFDVLIGMDVLGKGKLLIEAGRFEFSF